MSAAIDGVRRHRRPPAGFSIIELMVAMAIGLVLSIAVARVLIFSQESRLTTTSVNDINQTGNYLSYVLDRTVRSAGSGYAQRRSNIGCLLTAARATATILPRPTALQAPFAGVTGPFRLAPVVIFGGASAAGSDVLAVMTGTSGYGESAFRVNNNSSTGSQIRLPNTLGFRANDMMLLVDEGIAGCMLTQVGSTFSETGEQTIPLAGTYYNGTINSVNLTDFSVSGDSFAIAIGRGPASATAASPNPPQFQLFGVGANNTLFSHDLLRMDDSDAPVPVAEGVVEMRAIYHVDSDNDGTADAWRDPRAAAGAGFTAAELLNGSTAARDRLNSILAVRIGLLLRTALPEKPPEVAAASYTFFANLTGATTRTLTPTERQFRHRILEITVPLRNSLMPAPPGMVSTP